MLDLRNYKIGTRLIMTTLGALGLMIVFVGIALQSLNVIGGKVEHILGHNVRTTELAVEMRMRNLQIGSHVRTAMIVEETDLQMAEKARVEAEMARYLGAESQIVEETVTAQAKEIVGRILPARQAAERSINEMFVLIKAGNHPEIERHFFEDFQPKLEAWFEATGAYVQLQRENNVQDAAEIGEVRDGVQNIMLLLVLVAVFVMIPSGLWVTRQITGPLHAAVAVAESVAGGNMENHIDLAGRDEPSQLMRALDKMQLDLRQRTAAERKVADENLRIRWRWT